MNTKGSQWQIQQYINDSNHVATLNCAVATALGHEFGGEIEWVSPLQKDGFAEYRDGAFLNVLGLDSQKLMGALSDFWPSRGPRWDALAKGAKEQVFLVEGKSYPGEVRSGGSRAGEPSLTKINSALRDTALWLQVNNGVPPESWSNDLYQSANRLAHLYFLRRHEVNAFLLNVCFVNDTSHMGTELERWLVGLQKLNQELGVEAKNLPYVHTIFLPGIPQPTP